MFAVMSEPWSLFATVPGHRFRVLGRVGRWLSSGHGKAVKAVVALHLPIGLKLDCVAVEPP